MTLLRGCIALLALALAAPAVAADVVILKNGDRITGKITKIWDGEVTIEPEYADEIKVSMDKVKAIDARRDFEFEYFSGEKFTGQFGIDAQGNQVLVRDGRETPLDLARVEEIAEPQTPFEWEARVDVNGDRSSGNTTSSNLRVQAYGLVRFNDHRHELRVGTDFQSQDEQTLKNQYDAGYDYNWLFGERWYLSGSADYERDPARDLDRRVSLGAGLGYQFFDDAHRRLKTSVGPSYVDEQLAGVASTTGAWQWQLDFRHKFYRRKFEYFYRHDYLVYTGGSENRVFQAATGLRLEITDDFYVNLEYDYDYEARPAPGRQSIDRRFLVGIGLKLD
jgi:putative salt-induced outer membrane protein YdiY